MANEWRDVALVEVADEVTVGYVGPMAHEYVSEGIPFLRSLNVDRFRINQNDQKFISAEFHSRIQKSKLQPGDVVIVRTGKPGTCAVVPDWLKEANCSDLVIVRCGPEINNRYLAYFVNSAASDHIAAHLVGAVQQHFNVSAAKAMRLRLPPLPEQRAIAHILGTLDDKIELNRRANETLEEMARALFKAWFMDFEPVRAKLESRWQRGQSLPGLPAHLYDLFPDRFVESEPGEIPEGWEMRSLGQILVIVGGGTPKTSNPEFWGGDIPWFSVVDTPKAGDVFVIETESSITQKGLEGSSARLIPKGATIISARGTVGNLAIAGRTMTFNQSCYGLSGADGAGDYFVYLVALQMVDQLKAMAHGSVFSTITRQTFDAIKRPMPPSAALQQFESSVTPWFEAILTNVQESRSLAQLRDTLLPKLISGELRVLDAERIVGAVS